jgi:hypothetical protein
MEIIESRSIDFQGGMTGCKVIANTSANTGAFQAFVVNADAVVSVALDRNGNNITSSLGLTGVTLSKGMLISMPKGDYFSSITLTSGSIIGYLI